LAEMVSHLLINPESVGQLDEQGPYLKFVTAVAEVVCDFCGGEVSSDANQFEDEVYVGIRGNDSLPDDGGIWKDYDQEGDL